MTEESLLPHLSGRATGRGLLCPLRPPFSSQGGKLFVRQDVAAETPVPEALVHASPTGSSGERWGAGDGAFEEKMHWPPTAANPGRPGSIRLRARFYTLVCSPNINGTSGH